MLIILSKSPLTEEHGSILEIAKKFAGSGEKVTLLHIHDACIATTMNEYCSRLADKKIEIYALKADCTARGLTKKINEKVKLIDYRQWVRLVMIEHENIVSWTS